MQKGRYIRHVTELRHGCLAVADISGYTRYLSEVELEHSQDVLADLLATVARELEAGIGPVAKLEGDAVFVCDGTGSADGEAVLACLDAAYFAFARRRRTIERRSSCTCQACARIPSLDLKLIVHHGEFIQHTVAGRPEVLGPDVIAVHRLLKNQIDGSAFALITNACCRAVELDPHALSLQPHTERYDDMGEIPGWIRDLGTRWTEANQRDQVRIAPEEADLSFSAIYDAPAAAVWDSITAPEKILQWKLGATDVKMDNPSGARDVGSVTHCIHGRKTYDEEILDWRPFSYFSYQEKGPIGLMLWTFELAENESQTALDVRIKGLRGRRQALLVRLSKRKFSHILGTSLENLRATVSG